MPRQKDSDETTSMAPKMAASGSERPQPKPQNVAAKSLSIPDGTAGSTSGDPTGKNGSAKTKSESPESAPTAQAPKAQDCPKARTATCLTTPMPPALKAKMDEIGKPLFALL